MYLSCSAINFFLHAMIYKYLISLSIIINIKLYFFSVVKFVDLDNLMMKFIVTSFHNDSGKF